MKMRKEIAAILLTAMMGLTTFSGCGKTSHNESENERTSIEVTISETAQAEAAETLIVDMNDSENIDYGKLYYAPLDKEHVAGDDYMKYVDNEILIVVKEGVPEEEVSRLAEKYNGEIVGEIEVSGDYQIRISDAKTESELEDIVKLIEAEDITVSASLNYVAEVSGMSRTEERDGFYFGKEWEDDLQEFNDCCGKSWGFEAINTVGAWDELNDHKDIVTPVRVGLIDGGFDVNHEDLGFAQVFYDNGANGVTGPTDSDCIDHGTHVAGIMAAKTDDSKGICGVYPYGDKNLYGVSYHYAEGLSRYQSIMYLKIAYAELIVRNVKVINVSEGFNWYEFEAFKGDFNKVKEWMEDSSKRNMAVEEGKELGAFLDRLLQKGYDFVIVTSAGNDSDPSVGHIDCRYASWNTLIRQEDYPKVYDRIIVVGAVGYSFNIADYSNGGDRVDIYAPGGNSGTMALVQPFIEFLSDFSGSIHQPCYAIYSTTSNNGYGYKSGTSVAAPHVAGVAAMVWSANNGLTGSQVKSIVIDNSSNVSSIYFLNAERAVRAAFDKGAINNDKKTENGGVLSYVVEKGNESNKINKAKVTLKNEKDGTLYEGDTDSEGHFEIMVPEGQYTLSVKAEGYRDYIWPDGVVHKELINVSNEEINYLDWIKLTKKDSNDTKPDNPVVDISNLNEWDYVTFGSYEQDGDTGNGKEPIEWIIVHKEADGSALLMSRYVLDRRPYNDTQSDFTMWETSTIRQWLNSSFYDDAFSAEEKNVVREAELKNDDYDYEMNTTNDRVFLLSLNEIEEYFPPMEGEEISFNRPYFSERLWCESRKYDTSKTDDPEQAETPGGNIWSLRTTYSEHILFVDGKAVWVDPNPETMLQGIRPAIWIKP